MRKWNIAGNVGLYRKVRLYSALVPCLTRGSYPNCGFIIIAITRVGGSQFFAYDAGEGSETALSLFLL